MIVLNIANHERNIDNIAIHKHYMHIAYTAQSNFPIAVKCLQNVHLFMF